MYATMSEKTVDEDLLTACRRGDSEALQLLFEKHQRRVYSIALNFFGGDDETAKDATQQVFLKLFVKIEQFRSEAEFTTWLYRIVVNTCIDEQRKQKRFFPLAELIGMREPRMKKTQEEKFERRELSDEVQKAVAGLKPKLRLPILLKYVEGLSYDEIANVLEISSGTVASRLNRGHKALAKELEHLKTVEE
jgi:RNA polymerase sigma-70 factor (ECF subfamily)